MAPIPEEKKETKEQEACLAKPTTTPGGGSAFFVATKGSKQIPVNHQSWVLLSTPYKVGSTTIYHFLQRMLGEEAVIRTHMYEGMVQLTKRPLVVVTAARDPVALWLSAFFQDWNETSYPYCLLNLLGRSPSEAKEISSQPVSRQREFLNTLNPKEVARAFSQVAWRTFPNVNFATVLGDLTQRFKIPLAEHLRLPGLRVYGRPQLHGVSLVVMNLEEIDESSGGRGLISIQAYLSGILNGDLQLQEVGLGQPPPKDNSAGGKPYQDLYQAVGLLLQQEGLPETFLDAAYGPSDDWDPGLLLAYPASMLETFRRRWQAKHP